MLEKIRNKMGFPIIALAFFFLFEPTYALIDAIPDIIGYILLCLGLAPLSRINHRIADAKRGFLKCTLVATARWVAYILLNRLFADSERAVGTLVFVFVIAFFDILFLLPSYKALFEGLLGLGTFYNGGAVFYKKRELAKNRTEKLYALTVVFVVFKSVICALPDFTTLQNNSSYEFITITRIFAILLALPISIAWLISAVSYFISLKRDEGFVKALTQKHADVVSANPNDEVYRQINMGLISLIVSAVLTLDIYEQNVNYLPELFFFASVIISALYLRKYAKFSLGALILSCFGAISSVFLYIVERNFFERHFIGAIKRDYEAYTHYYFMLALYVLNAVLAVATVVLVAMMIYSLFKSYVFDTSGNSNSARQSDKGARIRLTVFSLLGAISQASTVFYAYSLPYFSRARIFEYSLTISVAFTIAFVISAYLLISYVRSELKEKHSFDD